MKSISTLALIISLVFCINAIAYAQEAGKENGTVNTGEGTAESEKDDEKKAEEEKIVKVKSEDEIVITATKSPVKKRETGASITVVTSEEIEQKGKRTVLEILRDTPGLFVSTSSSLGGLTDIYIRGTKSTHVVVLVDGVRVNDPSSPDKGFDFAHLTSDNIERIEVVRGSQSTLYGSDAIGGVINIITKKGKGKPTVTISAEGGSYCTFKESASVIGGSKYADYSFSVSRTDSRGYSKASHTVWQSFTSDKDGYENTTASSRIDVKTIRDSVLTFAMRYTDTKTDIDDGAWDDDKNRTYEDDNLSCILKYTLPVFKWWETALNLSYMRELRRDRDRPDVYDSQWGIYDSGNMWFRGQRKKAEFKNTFNIKDVDEIIVGCEYEIDYATTIPYYSNIFGTMDITQPIDKNMYSWALYAQNHLKLLKRIYIITGIRYTEPEFFQHRINYSLSGSFILPKTETRLKANLATGYKTPSMYQLFSFYEKYSQHTHLYLKPEETLSHDFGIEQPLWDGKIVLDINYFTIDYKSMIFYDDATYRYYNIKGLSRGVECILAFNPVEELLVTANYTYTRSVNKTYHNGQMMRRPKHQAGININYSFLKKGNVNLGIVYVGERKDYTVYPYYSYMNPFYRVDLSASYWIIKNLQAFFRIENLTNNSYEEIRGYRTPLISFYGGLKAKF